MTFHGNGNTVFLTEKEAERIKNTAKQRLKKCSKLQGHVREPRDSKAAIFEANGASLMADMGCMERAKVQRDTMAALVVGQVYPPSIVAVQNLQPMKLADLQMENHHHGRILSVKRVSPVVVLAARSWTVVQDAEDSPGNEAANSDAEHLEVCLHKLRHGREILESASIFTIKEPYFTLNDQGQPTIRIDHPSDLVIVAGVPSHNEGGETATDAEKLARAAKNEGNAALKKQDLPLAYAKYTTGLRIARQDAVSDATSGMARDIFRNRALANLLMGQFDEAKTDATSSLLGRHDEISRELDSKAYSRVGSAAYNLGEYREAKRFFEKQLELTPGDKVACANLRRVVVRLREQETWAYDLRKLRAGLSRSRRADAANFTSSTELRDSPGRGRGLFATRDIPVGDIIMCEKAFCVVSGHEDEALTAMTYDVRDDRIRASPAGLTRLIVQKLLRNPSQIERVMDLYADYQGDDKAVTATEDGPVVDTFRVHDLMSRNAFSLGEEGACDMSTGLWIWAAYMNHSCAANSTKEFVGDLLVLRAARHIVAGEEVFISYYASSDYDARKEALMTTWGFECNCALCTAEMADDAAVRKKRLELATDADVFLENNYWANATRLTIFKAQRLEKAIAGTYDEERYESVPRVAIERIQEWLAKAKS